MRGGSESLQYIVLIEDGAHNDWEREEYRFPISIVLQNDLIIMRIVERCSWAWFIHQSKAAKIRSGGGNKNSDQL